MDALESEILLAVGSRLLVDLRVTVTPEALSSYGTSPHERHFLLAFFRVANLIFFLVLAFLHRWSMETVFRMIVRLACFRCAESVSQSISFISSYCVQGRMEGNQARKRCIDRV